MVKQEDGCWIWTGGVTSTGHGTIRDVSGASRGVHRIAYEQIIGPIPAGHELHHVCEVPRCCNPEHLRPLTPSEHARITDGAAYQRSLTHCPQGHHYDEANTMLLRSGSRRCRTCDRARLAAARMKRREAA